MKEIKPADSNTYISIHSDGLEEKRTGNLGELKTRLPYSSLSEGEDIHFRMGDFDLILIIREGKLSYLVLKSVDQSFTPLPAREKKEPGTIKDDSGTPRALIDNSGREVSEIETISRKKEKELSGLKPSEVYPYIRDKTDIMSFEVWVINFLRSKGVPIDIDSICEYVIFISTGYHYKEIDGDDRRKFRAMAYARIGKMIADGYVKKFEKNGSVRYYLPEGRGSNGN